MRLIFNKKDFQQIKIYPLSVATGVHGVSAGDTALRCQLNLFFMKAMVSKTFMKVIGFAGCLFLTLFAGLWGFVSLSALFMSIIESDFFNMVGCVAAGAVAWFCWSLRKAPLM